MWKRSDGNWGWIPRILGPTSKRAMWKIVVFVLFLAASLLCGCHKKPAGGDPVSSSSDTASAEQSSEPVTAGPPDAAQSASPTATPQPEKPLPAPPPYIAVRAVNVVRATVEGEVDAFLTAQLRSFVSQKQRLPRSFAEFTSSSLDSVPNPPEGKKWAIDGATIEVKSVQAK